MREEKLLHYLALYNTQFLYQKAGYILQHFQSMFNLSDAFFDECLTHIGKSTRYLGAKGEGTYCSKWQIIAPQDLSTITDKGVSHDADI
jgi:hypothetical protein